MQFKGQSAPSCCDSIWLAGHITLEGEPLTSSLSSYTLLLVQQSRGPLCDRSAWPTCGAQKLKLLLTQMQPLLITVVIGYQVLPTGTVLQHLSLEPAARHVLHFSTGWAGNGCHKHVVWNSLYL